LGKRIFTLTLFLGLLISANGIARATSRISTDRPALVFLKVTSPDDIAYFTAIRLPVYAVLDGGLLTGADRAGQKALDNAGLSYQVLDPDLRPGSYYLAQSWPSRPTPNYSSYGQVLFDLGNSVILWMDASRVDDLIQAGAELSAITLTPKALPTGLVEQFTPTVVEPDPTVQSMVDQVSTDQIYEYDRSLAGEIPVWVDGGMYTIKTRYTNSGEPIKKATSYVGQHMANDLGLKVEYYVWNNSNNPDVIGEIPGLVNPDDIFIIGGHIDDVQNVPGADDNASGAVAALVAADIMYQYQWGCTLRFAVWTGEEQGLKGSHAYAQRSYQMGENIKGYLNLDMIAWNTVGTDPTIYLGYGPSVPESLNLANLFTDIVNAYNFDLQPLIGSNYQNSSDHGSFLSYGYPAILGIEGHDDFNPYYHSAQDTSIHTDPVYFTEYVKAAIATYAHMTSCLIPTGIGALDGHVSNTDGGAPIAGATVTADNDQGHHQSATTDEAGYYTRTLLANTYTVTASAYGYSPLKVDDVVVTNQTVTTQDFALTALPTYVVSGNVYDSVSGDPLYGTLQFTDAPVPLVNTDQDGFYSLTVAQGTWHLKATSPVHMEQIQAVTVNGNQTVDFYLDPQVNIMLPIITR
jgi:hypothetical protein